MPYETVQTDGDDSVGLVTLDHPESMNTFKTRLSVDLDAAMGQFEDDEGGIAVFLDGDGFDGKDCPSE